MYSEIILSLFSVIKPLPNSSVINWSHIGVVVGVGLGGGVSKTTFSVITTGNVYLIPDIDTSVNVLVRFKFEKLSSITTVVIPVENPEKIVIPVDITIGLPLVLPIN